MNEDNALLNFVTSNTHKFNEVNEFFKKENTKFQLKQCDVKTVEIQADTNRSVALHKLKSVKDKIDGSFFVEDAGFYVDEPLKGFPGVYSSYVFKTIGNEGILKLIDDFKNTKAHFSALFALYFKPTDKIFLFEGIVRGVVSKNIKGDQGFGFDPIFIPDDIPDKTFAEISIVEKNEISHRGKALKQLIALLNVIYKI
ncbi:MAG: RdgB/HAM1 family non-canonical purine NTP pyrophosphatase [Candidatus Hermodarchaeota archaeon]